MDSRDAATPPELCTASISNHQPGSHDTLAFLCSLWMQSWWFWPNSFSQFQLGKLSASPYSQISSQGIGIFPSFISDLPSVASEFSSVLFHIIQLNAKAPSVNLWWGIRHKLRNWTQISHVVFSHCPQWAESVLYATRRAGCGHRTTHLSQTQQLQGQQFLIDFPLVLTALHVSFSTVMGLE